MGAVVKSKPTQNTLTSVPAHPAPGAMAKDPHASSIPWWDKPFQTINHTSAILCGSNSRTYALLAEGELDAVRLAGKTLVKTASLVAFLEKAAKGWKPDRKRVEKAVAGRPDVARKRARAERRASYERAPVTSPPRTT
jgi:hypothetical protein